LARQVTYTASIINIRIVDDSKRDYGALISKIADLKVGVSVRKDTGVALTFFNKAEKRGTLSKYTQIDIDGPWFNEITFDEAGDTDRNDINVPEHLKPNLERFPFKLNIEEHLISFITKGPNGRRLSAIQVRKFFEAIVMRNEILAQFGEIDVTLVQDKASVQRFFEGGGLRRLEVIIRRPNDGLSRQMRAKLGKRLRKNNARELRETLIAERGAALTPTNRTKAITDVATTIGQVNAVKEVNGIPTKMSSKDFIESESAKFDSDMGDLPALDALTNGLEDKVRSAQNPLAEDIDDEE